MFSHLLRLDTNVLEKKLVWHFSDLSTVITVLSGGMTNTTWIGTIMLRVVVIV